MTRLLDAVALRVGLDHVQAVRLGSVPVWPPAPVARWRGTWVWHSGSPPAGGAGPSGTLGRLRVHHDDADGTNRAADLSLVAMGDTLRITQGPVTYLHTLTVAPPPVSTVGTFQAATAVPAFVVGQPLTIELLP